MGRPGSRLTTRRSAPRYTHAEPRPARSCERVAAPAYFVRFCRADPWQITSTERSHPPTAGDLGLGRPDARRHLTRSLTHELREAVDAPWSHDAVRGPARLRPDQHRGQPDRHERVADG